MHKVERAIILAAGIGKRMNPVTLKTPKPLVKVNGVRMIDTIIKALYDNGITEIYIVVGYLKEQFSEVLKEYQGITLIENPYYATCNNISSLYVARDYLENAIILDGDQIIHNERILTSEFCQSGYNSVWTSEDGRKLKKHLELEFEQRHHTQIYWDDIVMFCHPEEYQLGIFEMQADDVIEIDSLDELIDLDNSYECFREKEE